MIQRILSMLGIGEVAKVDAAPQPRKRSSRWATIRKAFLKLHPACEACGSREFLQVHHVVPFDVNPLLEEDFGNMMTLCEPPGGPGCHLTFGHLWNFQSWNPSVREDVFTWNLKRLNRPTK